MPPPINNLNIASINTTRLISLPERRDERIPRTIPITLIPRAAQLSQPIPGIKPTRAITRLTTPRITEIKFIISLKLLTFQTKISN